MVPEKYRELFNDKIGKQFLQYFLPEVDWFTQGREYDIKIRLGSKKLKNPAF